MGASKKLATANAEKAVVAALRQDMLNGVYAVGGSVATICADGMSDTEREEIAERLLGLLNQIEATKPLPEFIAVVKGAMKALGFEPVK
jgi:hypothetical protein